MTKHMCAAAGCTLLVPYDKLMCLDHWRKVPRPLQTRVLREWNGGRTTFGYLTARVEAIAAVLQRENEEMAGARLEDCTQCGGEGIDPLDYSLCEYCDGTGQIELDHFEFQEEEGRRQPFLSYREFELS